METEYSWALKDMPDATVKTGFILGAIAGFLIV